MGSQSVPLSIQEVWNCADRKLIISAAVEGRGRSVPFLGRHAILLRSPRDPINCPVCPFVEVELFCEKKRRFTQPQFQVPKSNDKHHTQDSLIRRKAVSRRLPAIRVAFGARCLSLIEVFLRKDPKETKYSLSRFLKLFTEISWIYLKGSL